MKYINYQLRMIGVMGLLVLMAAQCASPTTMVESTATIDEPVELTYVSDFSVGAPALVSVEPMLIDQFEIVQPNINISHHPVSKAPALYLTDSPPPDLVAITPGINDGIYRAINEELSFEISDIWNHTNLAETYPAYFRELGQKDGKQYFLPVGHAWIAVYYNKQVFEQYNLDPPTTWAEFLAVSDTLLANNVTPLALGGWCYPDITPGWSNREAFYWFDYLNLRLNGPDFQAEFVQRKEQFDEAKIRDIFETWQSLFDRDYFVEKADSTTLFQSLSQVAEGKAAMVLTNSADVSVLPKSFQEALDFFRFPIIDPNIPVGEITQVSGYVIPTGAPHPQAAMEFLTYLASVEGQSALAQQFGSTGGVLPVNTEFDVTDLAPKIKQGLALIQDADYIGQPYVSGLISGGGVDDLAQVAFCKFLRNPQNLEDVLTDLEKARQN